MHGDTTELMHKTKKKFNLMNFNLNSILNEPGVSNSKIIKNS